MQVDQDIKEKESNILFKPDMNKIYQMQNDHVMTHMDHVNNTISMANRSSMMTYAKIICCICSATIEANIKGMCETCARSEVNITEGITKTGMLYYCKGCDRYLRPGWVRCGNGLESPEMMQLCLSKIKGLSKVKLVDSSFVWTEPHSKIVKVKLTVQKEMNKNLIETSFIVEFIVEWTQCDDCKKTFTPHVWNASVQIRQKVGHKRTFMYLEQMILKNRAHAKALNIKEHPEGVDFFFSNKSQALTLADFIKGVIPTKVKQSKQLVSHDQHSNIFNYKYTFMIEMAPVCKEDIIVLSPETSKALGSIGPVLLCYKLTSRMHLVDPLTLNVYDFDAVCYWRHEFKSYVDRRCLEEFLIMNVEDDVDYSKKYQNMSKSNTTIDVEMEGDSKLNASKSTNYKNAQQKLHHGTYSHTNNHHHKIVNVQCIRQTEMSEGKLINCRFLFGDKIRPGDIFFGYDMNSINIAEDLNNIISKADNIPDVVLVKKKYIRHKDNAKRKWKLKHLNKDVDMNMKKDKKDNADAQYEEFLRDIEEDKDMRKHINLYKDDEAIKELEGKFNNLKVQEKDDSDIDIKVDELLDELTINDKEEDEEKRKFDKKDSLDFIENENEEVVDTKFQVPNSKKQIGKRERTGKKIDDDY